MHTGVVAEMNAPKFPRQTAANAEAEYSILAFPEPAPPFDLMWTLSAAQERADFERSIRDKLVTRSIAFCLVKCSIGK